MQISKLQCWRYFRGRRGGNKVKNEVENRLCYTVQEMAHVLGIGKNKAYELVNRQDFPSVRLDGRIIIPVEALNRWLNERAGA